MGQKSSKHQKGAVQTMQAVWSGGLNLHDHPSAIGDNQLVEAKNFWYADRGNSLVTRPGVKLCAFSPYNGKYRIRYDLAMAVEGGPTLYRIEALVSIEQTRGIVSVGDLGGYIENEYNLSEYGTCWIYSGSSVYGTGRVEGDAIVDGPSVIYDNVLIKDTASVIASTIYDNCQVYDSSSVVESTVYNNVSVHGSALVQGSTVYDTVDIKNSVQIASGCEIYNSVKINTSNSINSGARVYNDVEINGTSGVWGEGTEVYSNVKLNGSSSVHGGSTAYNNVTLLNSDIFGESSVYGDILLEESRVFDGSSVYNNVAISGGVNIFGGSSVYSHVDIFGHMSINSMQIYNNATISNPDSTSIAPYFEASGVYSGAIIESSNITVKEGSDIFGNVTVRGKNIYIQNGTIYGDAKINIEDSTLTLENTDVYGNAEIRDGYFNNSHIFDNALIVNIGACVGSSVYGDAVIDANGYIANSFIYDNSNIFGNCSIEQGSKIFEFATVSDYSQIANSYISGTCSVYEQGSVMGPEEGDAITLTGNVSVHGCAEVIESLAGDIEVYVECIGE